MGFSLHVYWGDRLQEVDMNKKSSITIGTDEKCDVIISISDLNIKIKAIAMKQGVRIKANILVEIDNEQTKQGIITPAMSCVVKRDPLIALVLFERTEDSLQTIDLSKVNVLTIGRNPDMNIMLKSPKITRYQHALIEKIGEALILTDNSENGTYVNGEKIQEHSLQEGDIVSIAGYKLIFNNDTLFFRNVGNDLILNFTETQSNDGKKGYPFFQVSPRILKELPIGEVEVQMPPNIGSKPEINWLSVLLPPIAMVLVMGGVAYLMKSITSLIYTAPMTLVSISVSIVNYTGQRKKHRKNSAIRLQKFNKHIHEIHILLSEKHDLYKKIMNTIHPGFSECIKIVNDCERRLWERRPSEKDFMLLKLGLGEMPFEVKIKIPKMGISIEEDALFDEPEKLQKKFEKVTGVPICVDFLKHTTVGIVGNRNDSLSLVKNLIVQIATHHSYEEVKIVMLFNKNELNEWSWIRWLPHTWDDSHVVRYIADSKKNATIMLKEFEEIIKQRERELKDDDRRNMSIKLPYIIFIIADKALIENETLINYITRNDIYLGVGALFLFDDISYLPPGNSIIIETKKNKGTIYERNNISGERRFSIEKINNAELDMFARTMAPIRIKPIVSENKLPNCITFLQGYNVKKPEDIDIDNLWSKSTTYKTMSVPIGVKTNGDKFLFDIWEKAHGPFGQVAGMPGSGKSEMVQTWILSMALNFAPQDVSFVLIDFKGSGLLKPFTGMPHIAGTISDIDKNINRNLIALESEMKRRKELFDEHNVQSIEDYLKLLHQGKVQKSCPFIIIVVDEFAEMKIQFPNFMPVVDSIFGIGRSLGMYCVLMSQKPGGIVSPKVEANTKFRWCLRVANAGESKEMIGHPEASKITIPGRGYIKIGDDEIFELIQSYWSGAPYNLNANTEAISSVRIATVDLDGTRHVCQNLEKTIGLVADDVSEIKATVAFLSSYVKEHNIMKAQPIWTPKLKDVIMLEEVLDATTTFNGEKWLLHPDELSPAVGMIDDPRSQSQYPLKLNIAEDGNIAIFGAPQTGKTSFLQTVALSLALSYSPDEVNIYVMDFGSWELSSLVALPHVGGVALGNEEEKIINLSRLIQNILNERRQGFATNGTNNVLAYRKIMEKPIPYIILLLDDFAPVFEQYPELESFFMGLVRSGSGYGVHLITTASTISSIPYRIRQNIKQNIALQMIDKTDYLEIVGRLDGLELDKVMGRGLIRGKPSLEFQTAYTKKGGLKFPEVVRNLSMKMNKVWLTKTALAIPVMPDIVTKSHFSDIRENEMPLGLTSELEQVFLSNSNKTVLVSGSEKSGKTNLLKGLAKQFDRSQTQIYWFDGDGLFQSFSGVQVISDREEMAILLQEILKASSLQKGNKTTETDIVLIVDNLPSIISELSIEARKNFETIAYECKASSINVFVSGDYNELSLLFTQYGTVLQPFLMNGATIVTGGALFHQRFITPSAEISYTEQEQRLPEFWGYYTTRGKTKKIKLILNS